MGERWALIIPCGDDPDGLAATLDSLEASRPAELDLDAVVVNDGGHAAVTAVVARHAGRVREIVQQPQRGSYAARNLGASQTQGDVLIFIDADCRFGDGFFPLAEQAAATADYIAADVRIEPSDCRTLGEMYSCLTEFSSARAFEQEGFGFTACLIVRRAAFDHAGRFDGGLRSGGDLEFGRRAARKGLVMRFRPDIHVIHPPRRFAALMKKEARVTGGNKQLKSEHPDMFSGRTRAGAPAPLLVAMKLWRHLSPPPVRGYVRPLTTFGAHRAPLLYALAWWAKIRKLWIIAVTPPFVRPPEP